MSDWIIPILIIVGAVIIAVLMRKQSAEYLKSDNKQKSPKQLYEQLKLRLSKKSPSHHPTPLESALVDHSQSSEQPQGSETNKTTHKPYRE